MQARFLNATDEHYSGRQGDLDKLAPVFRTLMGQRIDLAAQGVPRNMMVAEGFGDARPIATNDSPAGRAKKRRVELDIIQAK